MIATETRPDALTFALRTQLIAEAWKHADNNALCCQAGPWRWLHDPDKSPTRRAAALTTLCGDVALRAGCFEEHGPGHALQLRTGIVAVAAGAMHWLRRMGIDRADVGEAVWKVVETLRLDGPAQEFTPTFWAAEIAKHNGEVVRACFRYRDGGEAELVKALVRLAALAQWWLQVWDLRKLRGQQ